MVSGKPVVLDNGYVVPYNSFLSLKFDCHINTEIVISVVSVKYIYKYITKGPDRCILTVHPSKDNAGDNNEAENTVKDKETDVINEVENFVNAKS